MGFFSRFSSKNNGKEQQAAPAAEPAKQEEPVVETAPAKPTLAILAPITGTVVALEETSDPVFSGRAMGDGVAIHPTVGEVVAPVTGTIGAMFPTAHALAIETDDGAVQVMVHIGIDTVDMKGEGFTAHVAQGDHVEVGQSLVSVDLDCVANAGYDSTTFVVVIERGADTTLREHEGGSVSAGDEILWLS